MDRTQKMLFDWWANSGGGSPEYLPTDFSGLKFWFDVTQETGYANNDPVSQPLDFSGNNVVINNTGNGRPFYQTAIEYGLPGFKFDGTNDWWNGSKADFDFMHKGSNTLFFVLKLSTNLATQTLFDSMNSTIANIGRRIRFNYSAPRFRLQDMLGNSSVDGIYNVESGLNLVDNVPYVICLRFESEKSYEIYINNVLVATTAVSLIPSASESTNLPRIGNNNAGTVRFSGWLFEFFGYDRALSYDEIAKLTGGEKYSL